MTMTIEWAGRTEAGIVRESNEDAMAVHVLSGSGASVLPSIGSGADFREHGLVFSVADGVGGQNAGEVASGIVVAGIAEELARFSTPAHALPSRECGDRLQTALLRTNGRVRQASASDPTRKDMAATASVLWLVGTRGFFGQVGDSRIYRFRGRSIQQLSHDQSAVGRAVRSGQISEEEGKLHAQKNVLDQAMGVREEALAPEIDWLELMPGDLFLLCSDGLVDRLQDRDLIECLIDARSRGATLREMADALVQRAFDSESRDNVTVLLVRIGGDGSEQVSDAAAKSGPGIKWTVCMAGLAFGGVLGFAVAYLMRPQEASPPGPDVGALQVRIEQLNSQIAEHDESMASVRTDLEEAERLLGGIIESPASAADESSTPPAPGDPDARLEKLEALLQAIQRRLGKEGPEAPPAGP